MIYDPALITALNPLQGIYAPPESLPDTDLSAFTEGQYRRRDTGEVFRLKRITDPFFGRVVCQLKNADHFHECDEEKLASDFEQI